MIDTSIVVPRPVRRGIVTTSTPRRLLARGLVIALLIGPAAGCGARFAGVGPDTSEGEAVLAALEHVAEIKWDARGTTVVKGKLAVAYRGEGPLSRSTSGFLDAALEARAWRWSTENPRVPDENCLHPSQACRLKDPTELHLTFTVWRWPTEEDYAEDPSRWSSPYDGFAVEPVEGREGYKVHVEWLSSYHSERLGRDWAELGGEGLLVTPGPDGWVVERQMWWIT